MYVSDVSYRELKTTVKVQGLLKAALQHVRLSVTTRYSKPYVADVVFVDAATISVVVV